eukprot:TRINITY_DN12333_c5_g1_i1.p2 TRINITY_DN12333_c5_g1~~TRINITY_DN12333_c5_g1_i1.p2  ORF type:complete len:260 (+),score=52.70 TRINITY_DN12333_c5_g1_i1:115-780(+)
MASKTLDIQIVSDVVCPWCVVLRRYLAIAMERFPDVQFNIHWIPFFLNPNLPSEGVDKMEYYTQKFGAERAEKMTSQMAELMQKLGVCYNNGGLTSNTIDAHRLACFAASQGKQDQLMETLFRLYFCQSKCLGHKDVLLEAAQEVGLTGAEEVINNTCRMMPELQQEMADAKGITGVPHIRIGEHISLSGAQPPHLLAAAITEALDQSGTVPESTQADMCS